MLNYKIKQKLNGNGTMVRVPFENFLNLCPILGII